METEVKRTQRDYTLAFKLAVVGEVERGELTYKQAQRKYGIQGRSTVLVWLRKHGQQNWSMVTPSPRKSRMSVEDQIPLTPDQRIKQLEAELRDAREKAQLFEAVIDVLRKDYGVSIVKKPSGKSSRKSSSKG